MSFQEARAKLKPSDLSVRVENVPPSALPILAADIRIFGARVDFEDQWSGIVATIAGKLLFEYKARTLTVTVIENLGHFPEKLLIGGMRQMILEAVEKANWEKTIQSLGSVPANA